MPSTFRIITADECGIVKSMPACSLATPAPVPILPGDLDQARENGIDRLAWMDGFERFVVGRSGPSVEIWSSADVPKMQRRVDLFSNEGGEADAGEKDSILALHSHGGDMYAFLDSSCIYKISCADSTYDFSKLNGSLPLLTAPENGSGGRTKSLLGNTAATVGAFRTQPFQLAFGSRDREVRIYDMATSKVSWQAKNIPPHPQTLLQYPLWQTAVSFSEEDVNTLAVGTAYAELRMYDIRQRKPVMFTKEGVLEHRVSAVCVLPSSVIVGDSAGHIQEVDMRTCKVVRKFPSPGGAVRSVQRVPGTADRFAAVSLDRYVRVYTTKNSRVLGKCYLKQRLRDVLVGESSKSTASNGGEDDEEGEGSDAENDSDGDNSDGGDDSDASDRVEDIEISDSENGDSDDDDDESDDDSVEDDPFFKPTKVAPPDKKKQKR
jgi:hypothetical protein